MTKRAGTQFNCFSPPIMVATLVIEALLAIYTVWRYKMTVLVRLITAALLALGIFQLAEYFVCTGYGFPAEQWSRVGFAAITTLPALGTHILHQLAGKPGRRMVAAAYAMMAGFIIFFMTYTTAFIGHQCTGNYVIFQIGNGPAVVYGLYYYGWILTGIVLGVRWANQFKEQGKAMRKKLETVRALIIGYLVFLVPTAIANTVVPSSRDGIPSIMCGFAVLFALILALYVLPRAAKRKK
ncbi:MAG: hypothetical protein JWO35_26 [Candidatus Saccharibacteria bacterium]|nr:hypothetical protein [Candidatus Saccharibacteria bacterium]